jgi:hypothetical protein
MRSLTDETRNSCSKLALWALNVASADPSIGTVSAATSATDEAIVKEFDSGSGLVMVGAAAHMEFDALFRVISEEYLSELAIRNACDAKTLNEIDVHFLSRSYIPVCLSCELCPEFICRCAGRTSLSLACHSQR